MQAQAGVPSRLVDKTARPRAPAGARGVAVSGPCARGEATAHRSTISSADSILSNVAVTQGRNCAMNTAPFTERTPRIVAAGKLHRAAARRKAGKFIAEGFNAVDAALASGRAVELFVTEAAADTYSALVRRGEKSGVPCSLITDRAAASLADTTTSPGIFALCPLFETTLDDVISTAQAGRGLVVVGVDMAEPGNAGTLIRTADAVGADAVLFLGETVDFHGGKVVRASAGSVFHIPVARHTHRTEGLERLHAAGLQLLATAMDGEVSLDDAADDAAAWRRDGGEPPLLARPSAWLVGNEAHGLDNETMHMADARISIPIRGRAESLNVAAAASICLYEASRAMR